MKTFQGAISVFAVALAMSGALAVDRPVKFEKPEEVVAWLYRDFGWEAQISVYFDKDSLMDQPYDVLSRYFTKDLSQRLVEARKEEIATRELGPIDFNLIFGSQDPEGIGNLRILRGLKDNTVTVIYDQNAERDVVTLRIDTVSTSNGWRISNIHYHIKGTGKSPGIRFSLLELLSK